ncbi:SusC/RagA family TonB-linked outer membrane protein [Flammeovirga yaeyamensis]|uniref:SusC/RagA family TonB-linked outer membrane protein n=1 Tax=Flammeovirga yaeyamensis TaxID=367791 RepID=A0AAX1NFR4_9BACT|nr:TonB-dependent receptor [Flammeovirga yaeyamensis]MBB3696517.1 TonB-linked SusC/RagA family outer membrane protein [Flammeovirga yaeyamensis]NMF33197.1 TonB-dependent receptor [Flammeovirga yaeyamensis]QWG05523.1 SusC/RagA family TonB-linked outer membrane protein [Flammeovirga yaeyamensis]
MVKGNKLLFKLLLFILFIVCSNETIAQEERTIRGIIYDTKGITVPGASVVILEENRGSISDIDGKFTLENVKPGDVIKVTFIGYESYQMRIKDGMKEEVKIYLKEKIQKLDEIVVIGFGEQRKEDLTGSVGRVSGKEVERSVNASFENELQGRMAGVRVVTNSGQPGASSSISIRGVNSIGGNNQPLYVIDGVPMMTDDNMGFAQEGGAGQSALADINPADIASIEVLKDASSTAIYGAMGSNGVILITTKKGDLGKVKTQVSSKYGVQRLNRNLFIPVLDSKTFLDMRKEIGRGREDYNPDSLTSTNWQDILYKDGSIFDLNASVSGGNQKFNFMASTNYYTSDGIIENSGFDRMSFRTNFSAELSKKVRIWANVYVSQSSSGQVNTGTGFDAAKGQGSVVMQAIRAQPTMNPDGTSIIDNSNNLELRNSPTQLAEENIMRNANDMMTSSLTMQYKINNNFTYQARGGFNSGTRENNFYRSSVLNTVDDTKGWARRRFSAYNNWNVDTDMTHYKKWGKFDARTMVMASARFSGNEWMQMEASNFPSDEMLWHNMGAGLLQLPSSSGYEQRTMLSLTARSIMSYDNRYFLTASVRHDGASQFSEGNKWATFPAAALSWKLNNEQFLKDVQQLNLLKFRLSYGANGNPANRVGRSLSIFSNQNAVLGHDKSRYSVFREAFFRNDQLKWELTKELNLGFDASAFNNRIEVTADYYVKNTNDLLLETNVPAYTGFNTGLVNIGSLQNKGFEVALTTTNIEKNDFTWITRGVFTRAKTWITSLRTDTLNAGYMNPWNGGDATQQLIAGRELGTFWGYKADRIYQYEDFREFRGLSTEEAAVKFRNDLKNAGYQYARLGYTPWKENEVGQALYPGQQKYVDQNGDGKIDANDKMVIGTAQPDFVWSLENRFEYKNLSLSIFFMGEHGRSMANLTMWRLGFMNGIGNVTQEIYDRRWTPENPNNHTHVALLDNSATNLPFSDIVIEDASFIRLKRIDLMYRFNLKSITGNVSFAVTDLYTWTNYSGYNPDVSLTGHNALKMGHDYGVYPLPTSYTIGLNLTFN